MTQKHDTTRRKTRVTYLTTGKLAATAPTVYQAPIVRLQMVREGSMMDAFLVKSPADAAALLAPRYADCDREVMVVIPLNTRNRVIAIDLVAVGAINTSAITVREMYKSAILCNAAAVIAAHNHPSGDPTPSPEDLELTRKLIDAGELLDIDFLDHLILGEGGRFTSIREVWAARGVRQW
jgi:DNA repair protein RadC